MLVAGAPTLALADLPSPLRLRPGEGIFFLPKCRMRSPAGFARMGNEKRGKLIKVKCPTCKLRLLIKPSVKVCPVCRGLLPRRQKV